MDKIKEPPKIRVVVRKRPLFGKEITRNDKDILTVVGGNSLIVQELKEKVDLTKYIEEHQFTFDNVFEAEQNNNDVYDECVKPLVSETFKGTKTTCFAYGQTGSGKTFTMMGASDGSVSGMYTLASYDIIELLEAYEGLELFISFYEIYCGKLFDLLNKRAKVECREDNKQRVQIINLTESQVTNIEQIMDIIHAGLKCRTSGTTGANAESSRSHAILTYSIKHGGKLFSKMSFIDLAGSERGADVIDTGKKTKQDGAEINKSLLALKECIRALDQAGKRDHLPFRQSKLTQVLKDSFMGNSKTTMIANVSPALSCCEPTLNTLRYADRVKELKKDPSLKARLDVGDELSKELMLARQNKNVKIIEIDQKTGKPLAETQELAKDFKLTLKSGKVDPSEILAQKQKQKNQEKQIQENVSPKKQRQQSSSNPRNKPSSGIGGGIGSAIKQQQLTQKQSPLRREQLREQNSQQSKIQRPSSNIRNQNSRIGGGNQQNQGNQNLQQNQEQKPISRYNNFTNQKNNNQVQNDYDSTNEKQQNQRPNQISNIPRRVQNNQVYKQNNVIMNLKEEDEQLKQFDMEFGEMKDDDFLLDDHEQQENDFDYNNQSGNKNNQQYQNDYGQEEEEENFQDQQQRRQYQQFQNTQNRKGLENNYEDIQVEDEEDYEQFNDRISDQQHQSQNNNQRQDKKRETFGQRPSYAEINNSHDQDQKSSFLKMNKVSNSMVQSINDDENMVSLQNLNQKSNSNDTNFNNEFQSRLRKPTIGQNKLVKVFSDNQNQQNIQYQPQQQVQVQSTQVTVNSFKQKLLQERNQNQNIQKNINFNENNENQAQRQNQSIQNLRNKGIGGAPQTTKNNFGFGGNIGQQSQVIQDQQQNWRETSSKKVMFGSMIDESQNKRQNAHNSTATKLINGNQLKARNVSQAPVLNSGFKTMKAQLQQNKAGDTENKLLGKNMNLPLSQVNKREKLGDGVPTYNQLLKKYQNNQDQLGEDHEKIIEQILEEEEQLIFKHNANCKQSIKIVEEEMNILKEVDKPGSDVESYIEKLDKILLKKIDMMTELRFQLLDFYKNIKTEEQMAKLFQKFQNGETDEELYADQYRPSQ